MAGNISCPLASKSPGNFLVQWHQGLFYWDHFLSKSITVCNHGKQSFSNNSTVRNGREHFLFSYIKVSFIGSIPCPMHPVCIHGKHFFLNGITVCHGGNISCPTTSKSHGNFLVQYNIKFLFVGSISCPRHHSLIVTGDSSVPMSSQSAIVGNISCPMASQSALARQIHLQ